ncbi:putative alcohol dehydrogenase [Colletotrichum godetiae]|uniref:Alcohol dehydrogenase n=1 Tax=Colletotrichum godetiae TaxID=1209918 RepID=A0AAJ0ETT3_9PEZI|nr:putative alcohol dehydrogenase [Colletotrichum godetiae]KAK1676551.1 putative alcohol dehydrogenase [Colletotrichum godetiae]
MHRAIVNSFGPAKDVVQIEDYTPSPPGPGQVRVRMLLASINPSDLVTISGAYASRTTLPHVPGFEGVGVIESLGEGVTNLTLGQRVLPLGGAGAWQTTRIVEAKWCFTVPGDLGDEEVAMAYINPLTALRMVREYAPRPEGSQTGVVLVNAALSAIGRMIIRLLNARGVKPIALVRRLESRELLLRLSELGVSAVVCSSEDSLRQKLLDLTDGRGIAVAYDAVGGSEGDEIVRALTPEGTIVHYGLLSGQALSFRLREECPGVRIVMYRLRDWVYAVEREEVRNALEEAFQLIREGVLTTRVAARFGLLEISRALEVEATTGREGKVLLRISDDEPIVR